MNEHCSLDGCGNTPISLNVLESPLTFAAQIELCCSVMDDPTVPRRHRLKLMEMRRRGLPADADFNSLHQVWLKRRFRHLYKFER